MICVNMEKSLNESRPLITPEISVNFNMYNCFVGGCHNETETA